MGNFDPAAYVQFRQQLDQQFNFQPNNDYSTDAQTVQEGIRNYKGGPINFNMTPPTVPMSEADQRSNNTYNNPIGAAAAGFANAGSLGGVQALTGDQYGAVQNAYPTANLMGEIAGSVAGTEGIGALSRAAMAKAAPRLLRGGAKGAIARNLATDTAYGAAYGQNTQGDPITGAEAGLLASAAGQAGGRLVGAGIKGVKQSPAVQRLLSSDIPMTTGQRMGGVPKKIEDALTSVPVVGDIIQNRRLEGLQGFNQAAFNEAGQPIGAAVNATGEAGLQQLGNATSGAYDAATAGVNVPLDKQLGADLRKAMNAARNLPPDLKQKFDLAMRSRIKPSVDSGALTGEGYQQSVRGLRGFKAENPKPGFEGDYRDALTGVQNALTDQMTRGGGATVVEGLNKANKAYRNSKVLADAVKRARNGTRSGEVQTFTPSQLNDAAYAGNAKYPGDRPFADLGDAGQQVLPSSIPDSGTARRLALLPLAAVGGGGYGALFGPGPAEGQSSTDSAMTNGLEGAGKGLALAAALAAGGSKTGQKVLNKTLFDRPEAVDKLAELIRRNPRLRRALYSSTGHIPLIPAIQGEQ